MNISDLQYKKVGIVLSSSFFGFFAHSGFLKALTELNIKACGYSGTSAGALVAAMASAGLDPETFSNKLRVLKKEDFWDPDYISLLKATLKFFKGYTGLLKGKAFRELVSKYLPVKTFEECKIPCCIVAANLTRKCKGVFTKGDLLDAIHASCAVPGLFQAVNLNGEYFIDGGLVEKAPIIDLYKLTKPDIIIVHYISSQNLDGIDNSFMKRRFNPFKLPSIASSISNHQYYKLQCKFIRNLGCEIIEIAPKVTDVNPNKLENGLLASEEAYSFAKRFLIGME